jgi:hypothetical protein
MSTDSNRQSNTPYTTPVFDFSSRLACMLNRYSDQLPILNSRLEHLRYRRLGEDAFLLALDRQIHVDAATLGRRDLDAETVLRQEYVARVGVVELNRRRRAGDLQLE